MFIYLFWERERERERERGREGRGRERGRERIPSRLHTQCRAQCRTQSHHAEIMTWAKIKSQILNWLSHSTIFMQPIDTTLPLATMTGPPAPTKPTSPLICIPLGFSSTSLLQINTLSLICCLYISLINIYPCYKNFFEKFSHLIFMSNFCIILLLHFLEKKYWIFSTYL